MNILIIGSYALRQQNSNNSTLSTVSKQEIEDRTKYFSDLDIICSMEDYFQFHKYLSSKGLVRVCHPIGKYIHKLVLKSGLILEINIPSSNSSNQEMMNIVFNKNSNYVKHNPILDELCIFPEGINVRYASIELLYILKKSHRYLRNSPFFKKTRKDFFLLQRVINRENLNTQHLNFFLEHREKETYNYTHPKLNVSNNTFFSDDNVVYKYDHDSLHEAIKFLTFPAYTYFKPKENDVYCSEEKFNNCSDIIKLHSVLEESIVLSLERSIIPYNYTSQDSLDKMFKYSLEKVCTSITSGWFREYAYVNYDKVIELYNQYKRVDGKFYLNSYLKGIANNIVKPYNRS